jgi:ribokinase
MTNYDFIAIGDTTTDAFIRLKDASVHCDINAEHCTISMRWGDKIPFESSTVVPGVGNAANAAVAASRLGLATAFVSNIGDDRHGDEVLDSMANEKITSAYITRHAGTATNYHYVLWYESERTILVKHNHYPSVFPQELPIPKTIYFSSFKSDDNSYRDALASYVEANQSIFFAFQPGVFEIELGVDVLSRIYKRANFFVCNKEEAQKISGLADEHNIETLARKIHDIGPTMVVITDGPKGSYGLDENGKFVSIPIFPDPAPPVERTGAGDSFASTTAAFITTGMPLRDAMIRGSVNSAYVVQEIGAQKGLLSREKIEEYLKNAPTEYLAKLNTQ